MNFLMLMAYSMTKMEPSKTKINFRSLNQQESFYQYQIATQETEVQNESELPDRAMPVRFAHLKAHQQQDKDIKDGLKKGIYHAKSFHGAGRTFELIVTKNEKIVIPRSLKKKILD